MKSGVLNVTRAFELAINVPTLLQAELSDVRHRKREKNHWLELTPVIPLEASGSVECDLRAVLRNGGWALGFNPNGFPLPVLRLALKKCLQGEPVYRETRRLIECLRRYHRLLLSLRRAIMAAKVAFLVRESASSRRLPLAQFAVVTRFKPFSGSLPFEDKKVEMPREVLPLCFLDSPFREPKRIHHTTSHVLTGTEDAGMVAREIGGGVQRQRLAFSRRTMCKL